MKRSLFAVALAGAITLMSCNDKCCTKSEATDVVKSDFSNKLTDKEIKGGRLTPEILWKFGRIGGGVLSPDGTKLLYTVTRYDANTNKSTSNVFITDVNSKQTTQLSTDDTKEFAATWTEDGKKIAYMSTASGDVQVWTMNPDGSEKVMVSDVKGGINSFRFSPDGSKVMYTQDVKLQKSASDIHSDLPLSNAKVFDDLMYRHWNDWTDYKFSHIFVADVKNGKFSAGKDIMPNELWDAPLSPYFDDSEMTWSPDSKTIAYTCKKLTGAKYATSTNSDIYFYNTESGKTINMTEGMMGYDKYPVFSPDNKYMAFMSMETPGCESDKERLMIMDLATKEINFVNENWDQNAHNYTWSKDGKEIYFVSGTKATYQLYKVDIASKQFTQITKGQHNFSSYSIANGVMIGGKTTHQMATELFKVDMATGAEDQITTVNKNIYDNINLGHTEERWVTTTDGKQMLVWMIFPPNFDKNKKYPALLYCQGGPQSAVSQFFSYRWNFAMMAANDYIIMGVNRRGLPSFGKEWNAQISGDYSGLNIKDYLSAVDALKKENFIDENRLGCVGASYGGYSTFFLAGKHEKRFKAFIAHCGMFNLESFYGATEETFFPNHDLGGAYWDMKNKTAQRSYANSPHKFVQNWDTPILVIHGGKDFRIPYTEGMQAFNAARLRGIPARFLYFPEETHFVLKPQNSILWQREFFGWLDKYLK
ncbi:MAG: S9 family peptidase [Bacteroidales bacterium]|jgi:dipeptidyl aminopeptidase/acylaminoacyl peptidase|nr:S9 family peptidase [Bacteroidales bacterium]